MDNIGNTEHALTFADLRVHYYTGRSYLISGEGRDKVFGYRHGVMTDIGDLPEAEWTRLAKQLIRQSGEQELYQQLFAWEREQSHWEQSPSQFELDVLSLHMARLPDNPAWCDFIPFNRKYRPEVLCNAEILWVKCSGCGKRHEMTGTQLKISVTEAMVSCTAGNAVIGCRSTHALILRKGVMGTDKVVIVVKDGMVWEVFGACPYKFDVEILDMDFNGADPDAENAAQDRLQTVRQYLSKIY